MTSAFFEQQKTCPICQKAFPITRVRSSACYVVKRETDFNVIYRDVNPNHYSVWVCPNCQYAAPEKNFLDELRPAELERLKKGLALLHSQEPDFYGERTAETALRSYELAIRTAQIRQAGHGFTASLFLRAAWICRELNKTELEKEYIQEALKLYQHSYEKEFNHSSRLSDVRLMYIIGELNHRLDNLDEAIQWFSRAVMNKDIKREPEVERLLRDQWEIAREKRKKLGSNASSSDKDTSQPDGNTAETVQTEEHPAESITAESKVSRHRNKVKMFASIYADQVEWLTNISNACYNKTQILLGKEAVLRAALDALTACDLDVEGVDSEEALTRQIMKCFHK